MERIIKVTGSGKLAVSPDTIILKLPLSELRLVYADAIDALNESVSRLKGVIVRNGLSRDAVKTLDYHVIRETTWDSERRESDFFGYTASHDMEIEIPFDHALLNALVLDFSKELEGMEFKIFFTAKESEKNNQALIANAVLSAEKNARFIAKCSGVELGPIKNINFSFDEVIFQTEEMSSDLYYASFADVTPADIKAEKKVSIEWELL